MPKFWCFIGNEKFNIGCTGQTVYVYDKNDNELARFKDLKYAYKAVISPNNDIFVVKTTDGKLGVYSLETLSLVKKFRFSKVDGAQDENFCFSPDGKELYNIERHIDSLKTALSIYDTKDFSLKRRILNEDLSVVLNAVEYDSESNDIFLLGFLRTPRGTKNKFFVAKLKDDALSDMVYVSESDHDFFYSFTNLKTYNFTEKAYEWSYLADTYDELKTSNLTLKKLWEIKGNKK